jgi:hypothetical protein
MAINVEAREIRAKAAFGLGVEGKALYLQLYYDVRRGAMTPGACRTCFSAY